MAVVVMMTMAWSARPGRRLVGEQRECAYLAGTV